ncbi:MAG: hypothetical protein C4532_05515 [Candidatus Abyssobacteria bacterium SURF_17]|uniref:Uncharacterized protein n=1 Tax=Candidatus Abyssobacteria bacterium SURF_17 TaxID=2093361 RepID=A0A419F2X9_9BACT|nr:MAG: hypothetical protein C4532_05515 [Candidatus Abyssubacteria bacterium SURF_17]
MTHHDASPRRKKQAKGEKRKSRGDTEVIDREWVLKWVDSGSWKFMTHMTHMTHLFMFFYKNGTRVVRIWTSKTNAIRRASHGGVADPRRSGAKPQPKQRKKKHWITKKRRVGEESLDSDSTVGI